MTYSLGIAGDAGEQTVEQIEAAARSALASLPGVTNAILSTPSGNVMLAPVEQVAPEQPPPPEQPPEAALGV